MMKTKQENKMNEDLREALDDSLRKRLIASDNWYMVHLTEID